MGEALRGVEGSQTLEFGKSELSMQDEKKQGERGGEMAIAHSSVFISDLGFLYIYLFMHFI